jgi:hypothetical protein
MMHPWMKCIKKKFTIIINELHSLEKNYTIHQRMRNILITLPKTWSHITYIITEARHLSNLKLSGLIESIKANEEVLQEDKSIIRKGI